MKFKTPTIIQKNFRLILNTKTASLIIILGPLLLIGIIGLALHDSSIKNIKAGIYAEGADQEFLDDIQAKLHTRSINSEQYSNLHWCQEDVKSEKIQLCIEIPPTQTGDFGEITQDIVLHVDFSKQRTVWNIIGRVQGIVDDETNSYREKTIDNIKIELEELKTDSESTNNQINQVINSLDELEILLNNANKNEETIKSTIFEIESNINQIDNQLNDIGDILEESPIPSSEYASDLRNIQESINRIQSLTNNAHSNLNEYYINSALIQINSAITELTNTKEKLEELDKKIESINNENIDSLMNPIKLTHNSVLDSQSGEVKTNLEFLDYLFPSFLVFFILFDSIIFSASTRIKERKTNAYLRNTISKANGRNFILGDLITSIIVISIQITTIILLASLFLNLSIMDNINAIITITVLSVTIFSLIGITIGSIFSSQESVIITSISTSLLFFIFSSLVTPLETLPRAIAGIVKLTPLALLEGKLRLTTIFNLPLQFATQEIIALIATAIICITITAIFYKKNKTREI